MSLRKVVAFRRAMSWSIVLWHRIWVGSVVGKGSGRESERVGWQDKSRDVRLGRSGLKSPILNDLRFRLARCGADARCACATNALISFNPVHLVART